MILATFGIAFVFSFLGSIPPGTINLGVLQLSLDNKYQAALRFALAAALVEFPYALIAVKFQAYLTSSPIILDNLTLIAAVVMVTLGAINILYSEKSTATIEKFRKSGFRKGVIISILNPLAIPFWIGITAYLSGLGWVNLNTNSLVLWYVTGVSAGTFILLALIAFLGNKMNFLIKKTRLVHQIPGVLYIILGIYAFLQYLKIL
ncbi:MAG: LysE family transporter [Fulvivirga sp.]|nr:LysE family transporter [Fulvivirga sp.]